MATRRFEFGPQPALDKAVAEEEHCQRNVAIMVRTVEEERRRLEECMGRVEETRQQIRREHDNLVSGRGRELPAGELMARSRHIDALCERERTEAEAVERQRKRLREAEQILADRQRELAEAMAQVKALEKLKETRWREFQAELEKREEIEREDEANQRWKRREP